MLSERDGAIVEMMDDLAQDDAGLRRSLADIRRINTILGWRRYAVGAVARRVRASGVRSFSLLDLASGSADIPLAIADWAKHAGVAARIVVSDIHPVMLAVAREQTRNTPTVTVEECDALNPHYPDGSFDIALCTLAVHHFAPEDAVRILRAMGVRSFSLLDLASGSADIPLAIADWAKRAGVTARIVVSDIHPVMLAVAREQTRNVPNVTVETCDALDPHYADGSFDIALCTLALHHFSPEDATQILRSMARVGRRVLVFDLARARLAYIGALAMTRVLRMDPITRFDAPASVRRAYTVAELRALANQAGLHGAQVAMRFPFRLSLDAPGIVRNGETANG